MIPELNVKIDRFPIIVVAENAPETVEAMGTKKKFWFRHESLGFSLYKMARSGTGEDWSEKAVEEICKLLNLPHARYELAAWTETYGVVSPTIVPEGGKLIHGNELLVANVRGYPKPSEAPAYHLKQYTLERVITLIEGVNAGVPPDWSGLDGIQDALSLFVGYLLLDAWVGHTDRHHENWAFIEQSKTSESFRHNLYLAPTYDHASSLGRNEPDQKRQKRLTTNDRGFSVAAYAQKARSAFYRSEEDARSMTTIEMFKEVIRLCPLAAEIWLRQLASVSMNSIERLFERMPQDRMSSLACEFAKAMLHSNRENLLSLLETQ